MYKKGHTSDNAKTLIGQSALKRHVEVNGREPRWLSTVSPMKFRRFDDSTQHSQGAVELRWDLGEKVIRFVAHAVLGNSGLLLGRSDLNALGATIDLSNDLMHLVNQKLFTTPAGHFEVGLLNQISEAAVEDSLDKLPGSTVKDFTKDGPQPRGRPPCV